MIRRSNTLFAVCAWQIPIPCPCVCHVSHTHNIASYYYYLWLWLLLVLSCSSWWGCCCFTRDIQWDVRCEEQHATQKVSYVFCHTIKAVKSTWCEWWERWRRDLQVGGIQKCLSTRGPPDHIILTPRALTSPTPLTLMIPSRRFSPSLSVSCCFQSHHGEFGSSKSALLLLLLLLVLSVRAHIVCIF